MAVRGKKVAITPLSAKFIIETLLIASTKVIFVKDEQNVSVKKI